METRSRVPQYLSLILGQIATWLGVLLSVGYGMIFVLVLAHEQYHRLNPTNETAGLVRLGLPVTPPLLGLAFGILGLAAARWSDRRAPFIVLFGVASNLLPLALSLGLRWMGYSG